MSIKTEHYYLCKGFVLDCIGFYRCAKWSGHWVYNATLCTVNNVHHFQRVNWSDLTKVNFYYFLMTLALLSHCLESHWPNCYMCNKYFQNQPVVFLSCSELMKKTYWSGNPSLYLRLSLQCDEDDKKHNTLLLHQRRTYMKLHGEIYFPLFAKKPDETIWDLNIPLWLNYSKVMSTLR